MKKVHFQTIFACLIEHVLRAYLQVTYSYGCDYSKHDEVHSSDNWLRHGGKDYTKLANQTNPHH